MKRDGLKNIVASVQARLVERSRELGVEHQLTLARFGGERLLYRLSKSEFADRFILKGAALLLLWLGEPIRPTKDVDLLGFGDTSAEALKRVFVELCGIEAPDDGLTFLPDSVHVEAIREEQEYGGMRVTLMAMLGNLRIPLQVDIGAGDAVVPAPEVLDYPGLLDLPRARIRAYRPETSIAEKTEAMVRLALANSRMKDFFDIHRLAETRTFDGETMRLAVAATFTRRGIEIPDERPLALTSEFADDAQKKIHWAELPTYAYESRQWSRGSGSREETMTVKRIAASVVMGLFLWFVLLFIHEEWRLPMNAAAFGPPPFNPFNLWTPTALIAVIWASLNTFLRWADSPKNLEPSNTKG